MCVRPPPEGFLFPFGHRAAFVNVTERFIRSFSSLSDDRLVGMPNLLRQTAEWLLFAAAARRERAFLLTAPTCALSQKWLLAADFSPSSAACPMEARKYWFAHMHEPRGRDESRQNLSDVAVATRMVKSMHLDFGLIGHVALMVGYAALIIETLSKLG